MKAEIDTGTRNKEKDTMNETQATGKQATGSESASGARSLPLSTSSVNSGSKPEGPNDCGHNNLNAVDHRTVNGEEYTRWACLTEGCEVDYWADCDGTEIDPEDVEQELADAEADGRGEE